jgi:hypothetical protein
MSLNSQLIGRGKTETSQTEPSPATVTALTRHLLIGILVVATLLRVASALYQGNTVTDLPGIYDQISYHGLAQRVVQGHGFSFATDWWPATRAGAPTAHWSYLYTLYLATVYALFGVHPLIPRLMQAIIAGILHCWLAWRIGRRIFGSTTGLIAAGLSAVYIYFFYYAGGLLTETFYIIGILWTLDVALRLAENAGRIDAASDSPALRWWHWLELGLAIGVTVLLRQVFLLFVPFLYIWLWWNVSRRRQGSSNGLRLMKMLDWSALKGLIGAAFIVVSMIAPWTIRNYRAFGTFVPLNTNSGFAFFWGNHPIYGTHFVGLLPGANAYYELIPTELRHLNEAELDKALLKRGIGFVRDDPVRFVMLSLSRTREFVKFWPSSGSGFISNVARVGSFGLSLPFMLCGLWVSLGLMRQPDQHVKRPEVLLLYLFIIIYTGIHLSSWALIRYRLPVDAILLLFAALGLEHIARHYPLLPQSEAISKRL